MNRNRKKFEILTSHIFKRSHFYKYVNWVNVKASFDSDTVEYVLHHIKYILRSGNNFISIECHSTINMNIEYTYQFDNFDLLKSIFDNYETRHIDIY